jgi:ribonuclease T1
MSPQAPTSRVQLSWPRLLVAGVLLLGLGGYVLLSKTPKESTAGAVTAGLGSAPMAVQSGSAIPARVQVIVSSLASAPAVSAAVPSLPLIPQPSGAFSQAVGGPAAPASPGATAARSSEPLEAIAKTGDSARDIQIRRVVASMDSTGKPPEGVAQGGNPPGAFRNREGRLPRGGSYIESDIWPRARGGRGVERLIFGQERKVWFTGDHYETFSRLR